MSASQQKKTRMKSREEGLDKRLVEKKKAVKASKKEKRRVAIVCIVLAVIVLALVALNSSLLYNNFSAVSAGDVSFTASEYGYFYKTAYYSFVESNSSWISYFGLDTDKPLKSQECPFEEGTSWADYFKKSALTTMERIAMLWSEANAAGFTLDEEQQAELDEILESYKHSHEGTDFLTANSYIATVYGKGLNVERISKLLTMNYIADAYSKAKVESFTYTDEEIEAHYVEKSDDFDFFTYLTYYVSGAEDEENEIDAETAMAEAKAIAEAIVAEAEPDASTAGDVEIDADDEDETDLTEAVYDENTFKQRVLNLTGSMIYEETKQGNGTQGYSLSETYSEDFVEWVRDSARKFGDKTIIESSNGYYVLFYVSRDNNNYDTRAVRHVLINVEADEDGKYTDEAKEDALTRTETLLDGWKDGEATEDSFALLANAYSDDGGSNTNGGLYEDIFNGQMVPEFNNWVFDPARNVGDTGIVFNEGDYCGYHIIYFVGYGESFRNLLSDNDMRMTNYSDWSTAQLENYKAATGFTAFLVR